MPQKLTKEWKDALGEEADAIHGRYRDRLPNLTLSGDATNSSMAAGTFDAKREVYRKSPIGITRRLAGENKWNEDALERRAEELSRCVLGRWPWVDLATVPHKEEGASGILRWRIEGETWHTELAASQMVLNVAGALLSRDLGNARKLSGDAISFKRAPGQSVPSWNGSRHPHHAPRSRAMISTC